MHFLSSSPPLSELGLSPLPGPPVLPGSRTDHGKVVSLTHFTEDSQVLGLSAVTSHLYLQGQLLHLLLLFVHNLESKAEASELVIQTQ